ncbi:hypothetical protein, partial [Klebsiella pneumoniae]|uniref:hypothetical protein n=1 Tax=Klebsiella pneumoniae TaxID=573 RepID=UPI0040556CED
LVNLIFHFDKFAALRLSKCNKCFSVKPVPIIQPMGYLPPERVTATYAFMTTGVDYAGPFDVSSARILFAKNAKSRVISHLFAAVLKQNMRIPRSWGTIASPNS